MPPSSERKPRNRRWLWIPILLLLGVAYIYWSKSSADARANAVAADRGNKKAGRSGGGPAIPVVAARATRGNIGVYFNGLGAATPIYTVTVRSRVDGQLMNIFYREG